MTEATQGPAALGITNEVARRAAMCRLPDNFCPGCGAHCPPDDARGGIDITRLRLGWCGCDLSQPPWRLLTIRLRECLGGSRYAFTVAGLCLTGCDFCLFGVEWRPGVPVWQVIRCDDCARDTPMVARSEDAAYRWVEEHKILLPAHTPTVEAHTLVARPLRAPLGLGW